MKYSGLKGAWVFGVLSVMIVVIAILFPFFIEMKGAAWWFEGAIVAMLPLIWFTYSSIVRPVNAVVVGMDLLREQDYSSRLAPVGQHDADKIVRLFNDLMARLKLESLKSGNRIISLTCLLKHHRWGYLATDSRTRL